MECDVVKTRIKEIISSVSNIDPASIGDDTHFIEELSLDSLSLLEIGVDIDYEFKLGVPDDEFKTVTSVNETFALIERTLAGKSRASEVA